MHISGSTKEIKQVLNALAQVTSDLYITFSESEGVIMEGVGPANASLGKAHVLPECFDEIDLDGGAHKIGMHGERLQNTLQGDTFNMEFKQGRVIVESGGYKYKERTLSKSTMRNMPTISIDLSYKFEVDMNEFKKSLKNLMDVGRFVEFSINDRTFSMYAESDGREAKKSFEIDVANTVKCNASYDNEMLLYPTIKHLYGDATIHIDDNTPIMFEGDFEDVKYKFMVAPRFKE